jgi:hypothetical protein
LLELDRRKALRFHVSKTPAEYIGEVHLDDSGRASFTTLVAALYRHLFGAVPCDETEYAAFGAAAQELARGPHVVPALRSASPRSSRFSIGLALWAGSRNERTPTSISARRRF